ncbi:hypothetical protein BgiBS90_037589 [Biomphalaria glabrata]|nr:hypothetical protein BgiBS90_037589 [Biomphalaria glabrata]
MPRRPSSKKHHGKATVREHWGAGGRGQAITTNQIPAARRREADILGNIIAATYRQLVWMTRTKVWMKGKEKTAERLEEELRNVVDHHIQKIKI